MRTSSSGVVPGNMQKGPRCGQIYRSGYLGGLHRQGYSGTNPCDSALNVGFFIGAGPSSACGTSVVRWMPDPYTSKSQGSGWANCQSPMVGRKIGCKSGKRGATGRLREARSVGVTVDNFRGNGCAMLKDSPRGKP